MVYATGDIPVGAYNSTRLSNIGLGHGALDFGGGYTYFNPQNGLEFSAVSGLTYNFKNPTTDYQSGVDWHLDWGASRFLSKQFSIGLVGYFYNQISGDSGAGNRVGAFEVAGDRGRPANGLSVSGRTDAGVFERAGLQGVRCPEPARRLERVAHAFDLSCRAHRIGTQAYDHEVGRTAIDMLRPGAVFPEF